MDSQTAALSSVGVLIEAVGGGSQAALKRLYELESKRLYGIALRIVRRPEIASDVLQEAFVQIWQNAAAFSAERGVGAAWLTGIVRFRALDAVRKTSREVLSGDPGLGDEPLEPDVIENWRLGRGGGATALSQIARRRAATLRPPGLCRRYVPFGDRRAHHSAARERQELDPARIALAA